MDETTKKAVWNKGLIKSGYPPDEWRFDAYSCLMKYSDYGDRDSIYGWEIDHIVPKKDGGSDALSNLRPLLWAANVARNRT